MRRLSIWRLSVRGVARRWRLAIWRLRRWGAVVSALLRGRGAIVALRRRIVTLRRGTGRSTVSLRRVGRLLVAVRTGWRGAVGRLAVCAVWRLYSGSARVCGEDGEVFNVVQLTVWRGIVRHDAEM